MCSSPNGFRMRASCSRACSISSATSRVPTLSTLHHQVLAAGTLWDDSTKNTKQTFRLAVARKRRPWIEGLWANAGEPVKLTAMPSKS